MPESKNKTAIGLCVVDLTKYLMEKNNLSQDEAFSKLQSTVFYSILTDPDSGLIFEQNEFLFEALDIELKNGAEELNQFFLDN